MAKTINVQVRLREGEEFEDMLKRFNKKFNKEGVIEEFLNKRYYKKPSEIRNEKRREQIWWNKIKKLQREKKQSSYKRKRRPKKEE